jgi:hypothetical protein
VPEAHVLRKLPNPALVRSVRVRARFHLQHFVTRTGGTSVDLSRCGLLTELYLCHACSMHSRRTAEQQEWNCRVISVTCVRGFININRTGKKWTESKMGTPGAQKGAEPPPCPPPPLPGAQLKLLLITIFWRLCEKRPFYELCLFF